MLSSSILNKKLITDLKMGNQISFSVLSAPFITGLTVGFSVSYLFFKKRKELVTEDVLKGYHEENFEVSY